MPVDVEAYMAGAIPSVSRGGSWLPEQRGPNGASAPTLQPHSAYGSSPLSAFPQTPPLVVRDMAGSPIIAQSTQYPPSPSPSTDCPPGARSIGNAQSRTTSHNDLAGAASTHGLKRENLSSPMRHEGWLRSASEASQSVRGSAYQESFLQAPSSVHPNSQGAEPHRHTSDNQVLGEVWEMQRLGHRSLARGSGHSHLASIEISPPSDIMAPPASPYRKLGTHHPAHPSAHRRIAELLPSGQLTPLTQNSDHRPRSERPGLTRRHSHGPALVSKVKKHDEEDLFRSAQMNNRLARLSLEGRNCHTPDPEASSSSPTFPHHPASPERPAMHRRHSSVESISSSNKHSARHSHTTAKQRTTADHIHRPRHLSTPSHTHTAQVPGPSPSSLDRRPSAASAIGLASSRPRLLSSSPLTSPRDVTQRSAPSSPISTAPSRRTSVTDIIDKKPTGYVSPMDDDLYDPYEAHPAAPASQHSARQSIPSRNSASLDFAQKPPVTKQYIPPGFAKPTRSVPWNREGPAMKTHGIAWMREGDPQELPTAPKGPRWDVARPPRAENMKGGTWWESGSGGVSYNI
ncbi:uncharacterized protein I303_107333 [Kwoniella dejecticola CBS 10117]|uniref:Uncharacterized protein n=1 Tax=Kwoniella dejecticola CBS 10117 TaxID=1296121 RepID=A0A1A5ZZD9_9TREE|nr:uncharacterized protein I303_06738 [Kwoniella dejecticola CBS 10117]OBR83179.1 hypothetical protein I303_06738 [Kwoniella dejecticola CBS 10117]